MGQFSGLTVPKCRRAAYAARLQSVKNLFLTLWVIHLRIPVQTLLLFQR